MSSFSSFSGPSLAAGQLFARRAGSFARATTSKTLSRAVEDATVKPSRRATAPMTQAPSSRTSAADGDSQHHASPDRKAQVRRKKPVLPRPSTFKLEKYVPGGLYAPPQEQTQKRAKFPAQGPIYRAVFLLGLDPSVTLCDITQAIAQTAPVGRVLEVRRKYGPEIKGGTVSATVLFHSTDAAYRLHMASRDRIFRIKDKPPVVTINRVLEFTHVTAPGVVHSRVMELRGSRRVFQGVNEETIREMLKSDRSLMKLVPSHGLDSEPVRTIIGEDGAVRMIWPFFSNEEQTELFIYALRKKLRGIWVGYGHDPCYDPAWGTPLSREERDLMYRKFQEISKWQKTRQTSPASSPQVG